MKTENEMKMKLVGFLWYTIIYSATSVTLERDKLEKKYMHFSKVTLVVRYLYHCHLYLYTFIWTDRACITIQI